MKQSLNLSPAYCPNWGTWEVVREVYANAIDADPDNVSIVSSDSNTVCIETKTVPKLGELFIIGHGSKSVNDDNIGQFGEGLKIAALVATRTVGGQMSLELPGHTVRFYFQQVLDVDVLHAELLDNDRTHGYKATISMPGAGVILAGRILSRRDDHHFISGGQAKLFCKGIYICDIDSLSTGEFHWSYNINDLQLNRDRNLIAHGSTRTEIFNYLKTRCTAEMAETIVRQWDEIAEAKLLRSWYFSIDTRLGKLLSEAFVKVHGDRACIALTGAECLLAKKYGYHVPEGFMDSRLPNIFIEVKMVHQVIPKHSDLNIVDSTPYANRIDALNSLAVRLGFTKPRVFVYDDMDGITLGRADLEDKAIYLNSSIFGSVELECSTYFHELAHIQSEDCTDGSIDFERSLTNILGKLAKELI